MKTRAQISYNMSQVRSEGSLIERTLGRALWQRGLRYRKQYRAIPGRPDFAIVRVKVAVFCDSAFWHGRNWPRAAAEIKTNRKFWIPKIERNIARDREVGRVLRRLEWLVIRFWDDEILRNADACARKVERAAKKRQRNNETNANTRGRHFLRSRRNDARPHKGRASCSGRSR